MIQHVLFSRVFVCGTGDVVGGGMYRPGLRVNTDGEHPHFGGDVGGHDLEAVSAR